MLSVPFRGSPNSFIWNICHPRRPHLERLTAAILCFCRKSTTFLAWVRSVGRTCWRGTWTECWSSSQRNTTSSLSLGVFPQSTFPVPLTHWLKFLLKFQEVLLQMPSCGSCLIDQFTKLVVIQKIQFACFYANRCIRVMTRTGTRSCKKEVAIIYGWFRHNLGGIRHFVWTFSFGFLKQLTRSPFEVWCLANITDFSCDHMFLLSCDHIVFFHKIISFLVYVAVLETSRPTHDRRSTRHTSWSQRAAVRERASGSQRTPKKSNLMNICCVNSTSPRWVLSPL